MRNLRALVVTDPGLDMVNPLDESAQVIGRVIQQALAGHDPVADVTGEQQIGQLPDQLQGHPGVEQRTRTVGFETADLAVLARQIQRLAEKLHLLWQGPAVIARQHVDEAWAEFSGPGEFLVEVIEVNGGGRRLVRQHVIRGEDCADIAQAIGLEKGAKFGPFTGVQWQACFHAIKARLQQLLECLSLAGGVTPQRAKNFQLHR
ncbi:hypothetical protein D3C75_793520 [compost metagenome]